MARPDNDTLVRLYVDEQLSADVIGRRYGVHRSTVTRWLQAAGVARRPAGRPARHSRPPDAELLDAARRTSQARIAARYGVAQSTICTWIADARRRTARADGQNHPGD